MPAASETLHLHASAGRIAYQVLGDPVAERDVVLIDGPGTDLETQWEQPAFAHFLESIAGLGRLALHDARGVGRSDRVASLPTVEERVTDTIAVMDAVGIGDAVVIGLGAGTPVATLLAATHPERVTRLILFGAWARGWSTDATTITAWGGPTRTEDVTTADAVARWGAGGSAALYGPSRAGDDAFVEWCTRREQAIIEPNHVRELLQPTFHGDLTMALPAIRAPVMVLQRTDDIVCVREHARFFADHLDHVRYVELTGRDHWPWVGDAASVLNEIERFVDEPPPPGSSEFDRVLVTIVAVDVAALDDSGPAAGAASWHERLDGRDALLRRTLDAFRGRAVVATGTEFVALFDGAARAVRWADELQRLARGDGLELRVGVHTGEVEQTGARVDGVSLSVARLLCDHAGVGEILVSQTVVDLVGGSGIDRASRGEVEFDAIPGIWPVHIVTHC